MLKIISNLFKKQTVFTISVCLALLTSLYNGPSLSSIDFKVILSLFDLMLICISFEEYKILDSISYGMLKRFNSCRKIAITMILTTALLSMFITNDVALLTVVPLTIVAAKKSNFDPYKIITLETISANVGSSLTPFGNPQNLFLYEHFNIQTIEFIQTMGPFTLISILILILCTLFIDNNDLFYKKENIIIKNKYKLLLYFIIFIFVLMSILRFVDYRIAFALVLSVFLILDRQLISRVDYYLLATFICFFIFIGNISSLQSVKYITSALLNGGKQIITTSVVLSQFISNVPSAVLLSSFTQRYKYLLIGVNIGGMGTLIASLANLISYKFYTSSYRAKPFLKYFYTINVIVLLIMYIIYMFIIR